MTARPLILLTNDDGAGAEGLRVLQEAFALEADVVVVAPDGERSAVSHGISVRKPMARRRLGENVHALDATPADCVKFALAHLLDRMPQLVVSGVNPGANLGVHILYSGTVAAAREAALYGAPALAVSLQLGTPGADDAVHFESAVHYALEVGRRVLAARVAMPPKVFLNLNVPNLPLERIEGLAVTRQGETRIIDRMEKTSPGGNGAREVWQNVGDRFLRSAPDAADCDDAAVLNRRASLTPLDCDQTRHDFRSTLQSWFSEA